MLVTIAQDAHISSPLSLRQPLPLSLPFLILFPLSLSLSLFLHLWFFQSCHLPPVILLLSALLSLHSSFVYFLIRFPFHNLYTCVQMFTARIKSELSITPYRRQNITMNCRKHYEPNHHNTTFLCFQHEAFVHLHRRFCCLARQRPPDQTNKNDNWRNSALGNKCTVCMSYGVKPF